ncbi:MAG: ATP-binding protein [Firmicutes bacterium]|nr:ATP-binding protein [Bacillota bacterium]
MLRVRDGDKCLAEIISTKKENRQLKVSSRSWMIKYGIRRCYQLIPKETCPECGQSLTKVYRLHPFMMPAGFGRGIWLKNDCNCSTQKQLDIRKQLDKAMIRPRSLPVLPEALRSHTFADFAVESFNESAFSVCVKFAKNFSKNHDGKGLIICGKSGRGKTHLACAIINYLEAQYNTAFAHVPTLLEKTRQGQGKLEQLLNADLLVLDDLGGERGSEWALEKLLIIVDGRLNNLKATIYTTNFNFDELELRVGSRLASRILYNSCGLVVQGPDWRQIKYRRAGEK